MPHTNRKKNRNNNNNKRILVVDEDTGWTRVSKTQTQTQKQTRQDEAIRRGPLTIPADASVSQTAARYEILKQRWLASDSWAALEAGLTRILSLQSVSTCVLFGSGSATAHAHGWIDRHHVALTQIAVFSSVVSLITQQQQQQQQGQEHQLRVYAQEPDYTEIDMAFLQTLGIETVHHPAGFDLLSSANGSGSDSGSGSSFVYAPGAEVNVAMRVLATQPSIYLGHELGHYHYSKEADSPSGSDSHLDNKAVIDRFMADHDGIPIPDLDGVQDYPFHQQRLYHQRVND